MLQQQMLYSLGAVLLLSTSVKCFETNKGPDVFTRSDASFDIISGRNSTGYWNSKIRFTHSGNGGYLEGHNETDPWKMKFDQKVDVTEEGERITLFATVTIPPPDTVTDAISPCIQIDPEAKYKAVKSHGYKFVEGHGYYKFHSTPLTWYGALLKCQEETAHLIVINSEEEAGIVRTLFSKNPTINGANNNGLAFVGANDIENEGIYVTIFGEALQDTGYNVWKKNQPNNYGTEPPGEDCVTSDRDGKFYDWECYHKLAFFCEKGL